MADSQDKELGQLVPVALKNYWRNEAADFTPWLAGHLELLGNAIGMDLELVGTEKAVGDFSVDILAKATDSDTDESDTDEFVIIENQIEPTNHKHLGQLLTYASGHDARAVVWVASEFRKEHRDALDWLNERTSDDVAFFGVKVELWRIGDSEPAPRFSLVAQPKEWTPSSGQKYTEANKFHLEFWERLIKHIKSKNPDLPIRETAPRGEWCYISLDRTNFAVYLTIRYRERRIGCELFVWHSMAEPAFDKLVPHKEAIEKELGAELDWRRRDPPKRKATRLIQYRHYKDDDPIDFHNRKDWKKLFEWMHKRAEAFHRVFYERVQNPDIKPKENESAEK